MKKAQVEKINELLNILIHNSKENTRKISKMVLPDTIQVQYQRYKYKFEELNGLLNQFLIRNQPNSE